MVDVKPFDRFDYLTTVPECHAYIKVLEEELRKARADALEEAAKVAQELCDLWNAEWRKGLKCNDHIQGMSDGADDVAIAIRALKEKTP